MCAQRGDAKQLDPKGRHREGWEMVKRFRLVTRRAQSTHRGKAAIKPGVPGAAVSVLRGRNKLLPRHPGKDAP
jgi:hypothetical protein